ncbi:MAG: thiopurine S-methyltransferase [Thiogranum sp.]|jgi:thiopurine S-methyltransferase|nr:thiopurine S-methyltransferase [Thiogranum sp.]
MDPEFWHQRWRDNRIGFHQGEINPHLVRHWPRLGVEPGGRVLVPLCGKSRDMSWLAESHPVLGVELSPKAVEDFHRESNLPVTRRNDEPFAVYQSGPVALLCGDFFDLQPAHTQGIAAVYDRAALIALPADMRPAYAAKLGALVTSGTPMLLITLAYEQAQMDGPPFSVEAAEVEALFAADWRIESLQRDDILEEEPRYRERGLSRLAEHVYLLARR